MDGLHIILVGHQCCLSGGQMAVTAWWCDSGSHSQYSFSKSKQPHTNNTNSPDRHATL